MCVLEWREVRLKNIKKIEKTFFIFFLWIGKWGSWNRGCYNTEHRVSIKKIREYTLLLLSCYMYKPSPRSPLKSLTQSVPPHRTHFSNGEAGNNFTNRPTDQPKIYKKNLDEWGRMKRRIGLRWMVKTYRKD